MTVPVHVDQQLSLVKTSHISIKDRRSDLAEVHVDSSFYVQ